MSKSKRKLTGRYDPTRRVRPAPVVRPRAERSEAVREAPDGTAADVEGGAHVAPVTEKRFEGTEKPAEFKKPPVANQKRWGKRRGGDK